jgi:hypothetical protein
MWCGTARIVMGTAPAEEDGPHSMYATAMALHQAYLAVNAPDNTPPGIFLRLYIFGGLAVVILIAWFVLRGYRDTGDKDRK